MKAWVFVEGQSDKLGLEALWKSWRDRLRPKRYGIEVIPLNDKSNFFKKIGARAAEKLAANDSDIVVCLPDLHPTKPYESSSYAHADMAGLKSLLERQVRKALVDTQNVQGNRVGEKLERFLASAFKHDFEMLLLAARDALRDQLGTTERLGHWREPVEDQDLEKPPKRVIEDLFLTKSKGRRRYLETRDAPGILRRVTQADFGTMLCTHGGQPTCPEFVSVLRWLGDKLGEPCCELP